MPLPVILNNWERLRQKRNDFFTNILLETKMYMFFRYFRIISYVLSCVAFGNILAVLEMETKMKVVSQLNDNKRQIKKNIYLLDIYHTVISTRSETTDEKQRKIEQNEQEQMQFREPEIIFHYLCSMDDLNKGQHGILLRAQKWLMPKLQNKYDLGI